jgi:hypothetical protein
MFSTILNRPKVFSRIFQKQNVFDPFPTNSKHFQRLITTQSCFNKVFQQTQSSFNSFAAALKCFQHFFHRHKLFSTVFQKAQRVFACSSNRPKAFSKLKNPKNLSTNFSTDSKLFQ